MKRDEAKKFLVSGIDPFAQRKLDRSKAEAATAGTFGLVAAGYPANKGGFPKILRDRRIDRQVIYLLLVRIEQQSGLAVACLTDDVSRR